MAGGESCRDDCRTDDGSEQEELKEPQLKKQIIEQTVVVADASSSKGNRGENAMGALRVKKLASEAVLPRRGSEHAAGYDLSRSVVFFTTISFHCPTSLAVQCLLQRSCGCELLIWSNAASG